VISMYPDLRPHKWIMCVGACQTVSREGGKSVLVRLGDVVEVLEGWQHHLAFQLDALPPAEGQSLSCMCTLQRM
jgi:hypothetical protein